ncbi:MAG: S8 family serine peptidase, partial [Dehalococcoidia bacterium]|nr:S8 family serine peptidase [Dehalococcoidia bacterium]
MRAERRGSGRRAALLGALLAAGLLFAGGRARAQQPPTPGERVVVQYATGVHAQAAGPGLPAPSLEERGYRAVTVPAGQSREQFIAELRRDPNVVSAEPDARVYAAVVPNDPYYTANQAAYMAQINAPAGWELETGSHTVVVAVLDTGLDVTHPEFAGRLWENARDATADGVDDDGNKCTDDRYGCRFVDVTSQNGAGCGYTSSARTGAIADDHGKPGDRDHSHGTLVAGIIGAAGDNGVGVSGVAWDVRLMTVKVLDCGPLGSEPNGSMLNVAQGIDYARRMGANVINLSLSTRAGDTSGDIQALRDAIQAASDAGVIIVAAAGNHGAGDAQVSPGYPAAYTQYGNVIGVGAADANNSWATFSNYGPGVDFAAPGLNVAGTTRTNLGLSAPYGAQSGTSVSTPLVSGFFALLVGRNSTLPAADYLQIARATATQPPPGAGPDNWAGAGVVNLGAALARIPMTLTGAALKDWKDVPAGTDVRAFVGAVDCGATLTTTFGPSARYSLRVKTDAEVAGCGAPGRTVRLTVGGQPAEPTFTWGLRNTDLGLVNRDVSSVSPPPGAIVVQTLNGGWSNVAQLDPGGPLPLALANLGVPWTSVLKWDPQKVVVDRLGSYRHFAKNAPAYAADLSELRLYDAIWVDAGQGNVASLNPNPAAGRLVFLQQGWNNFVYTGSNRAVGDALSGLAG